MRLILYYPSIWNLRYIYQQMCTLVVSSYSTLLFVLYDCSYLYHLCDYIESISHTASNIGSYCDSARIPFLPRFISIIHWLGLHSFSPRLLMIPLLNYSSIISLWLSQHPHYFISLPTIRHWWAFFISFVTIISRMYYSGQYFRLSSKYIYWFWFDIRTCVGRCRSLITLNIVDVYLATSIKSPVNIYGFDSFRVFLNLLLLITSQNRQYPQIGEWSNGPSGKYEYTQDFANRVLSLALKPRAYERISLIPDFFSDSVPRFIKDNTPSSSPHADLRIGILHLDGDLYDSVYFPLVALERYIQPGGLVIFDDFLLTDNPSEDSWPGARRAYVDFMSEFSNYAHIDNIRGVAVLCKNS